MSQDSPSQESPRVFVSYSHDSVEHEQRVLELANRLRDGGIDCRLDVWEQSPPQGWPAWMGEQIEKATLVLVVCTARYVEKAKVRPDSASGVRFESVLILQDLYEAGMWNEKFIPVLLEGAKRQDIIKPLRPYSSYQIGRDYEALYRRLTEQPKHVPPPLGSIQEFPSSPSALSTKVTDGNQIFLAPRFNPYFTGRDAELVELRKRLSSGNRAALSQAIKGLGGIGKTQTAIAYCHEYAESYQCVFWVNADSTTSLAEGYSEIATALDLPGIQDSDAARQAVRRWLASQESWLLVLDNADDEEVVSKIQSEYLPNRQKGHLLVTTRIQNIQGFAATLPLKVMTDGEAVDLLSKRLRRELDPAEQESAKRIAQELGYLPLALEQAAAYISAMKVSFEAYLQDFRRDRQKYLKLYPQEGGYQANVATTWEASFKAIEAASAASSDVLRVSAFLAPEGIPKELFVQAGNKLGPNLANYSDDASDTAIGELLEPLSRYSLIEVGPTSGTFAVHRLVQNVVRDNLGEEASTWHERALEGLSIVMPSDASEYENWPQARLYFPHIETSSQRLTSETEAAGRVLDEAGAFAWAVGWLGYAKQFQERSLKILKRILGDEHPKTVTSMNNLAGTLYAQGNLSRARELFEKSLGIRKRILGDEHPSTATLMNNLALTLQAQGDLDGARELEERSLEILKRILGDEHPHTVTSMLSLALALQAQGDLDGARELEERSLEILKRILGDEHPDTVSSMNNLAGTLYAQGNLSRARELQESTLEILKRILGDEHPHTVSSMNNLAETLKARGDLPGARKLFQQAVSGALKVLGEEHPSTQLYQANMAGLSESEDVE